jgi:cupin 2 domain-containing protein
MPTIHNLFNELNKNEAQERFDTLFTAECGAKLERIVSYGSESTGQWYDQAWTEWVMLLSGKAQLEFADGSVCDLVPGDYILLPPHCRHRVTWTLPNVPSVWLALHLL